MNSREWGGKIDADFAHEEDKMRTIIRAISLDALSRIIFKTPVLTGRARGNWQVAIAEVDEDQILETSDKSGIGTIQNGAAFLAEYKNATGFPVIVIYNNLPYINRLENGWSDRAPNGMVAVTLTELRAEVA